MPVILKLDRLLFFPGRSCPAINVPFLIKARNAKKVSFVTVKRFYGTKSASPINECVCKSYTFTRETKQPKSTVYRKQPFPSFSLPTMRRLREDQNTGPKRLRESR
jgi:hypothetical protein